MSYRIRIDLPNFMETLASVGHRFAVQNDHVIFNLEGAHAVFRSAADVPCRCEVGRVGDARVYPPYARVHSRMANCGNVTELRLL